MMLLVGLFDFELGLLDVNELFVTASLCQYACPIYISIRMKCFDAKTNPFIYTYKSAFKLYCCTVFSVLFFEGDFPWSMKLQRLHISNQLVCSMSVKLETLQLPWSMKLQRLHISNQLV